MGSSKRIDNDNAVWLRQSGEGEKAYAAFLCYLEMGDERTIAEVGRILGKHRSQIDGWRSKFNWRERAAAYDNYLMSQKAIKVRREVESRYTQIGKISDELLTAGMAAIKTVAPEKMSPRTALEAINISLKLAEANRAMFAMNEREQAHDDVQNARVDLQFLQLEAAANMNEEQEINLSFIKALGVDVADILPQVVDMGGAVEFQRRLDMAALGHNIADYFPDDEINNAIPPAASDDQQDEPTPDGK